MFEAKWKNELLSFLEQTKPRDCHVVVMPDFFLDRIVNLPWNLEEFSGAVSEVANRKGGSIDGIHQIDMKGGNSVNTASALSRLGVSVTPIICTSAYGLQLIKYHFKDAAAMDFSHIKTVGKASITTALELCGVNEKVNVMLRDVGALSDFGPQDLNENDYKLIEQADYTCLFNWVGTLKNGTALAQSVFDRAKLGGGRTYYDTADPNPNISGIPDFIEKVLKTPKIDILSLNENEAVTYASILDPTLKAQQGRLGFAELAMEAARILARHFSARIDLHTSLFSATLHGNREVVVPTFKIEAYRATGAGDAWNAGNIYAEHNGLSDECRLMLANAVSACYLSGAEGMHPTKAKVASFLRANA